MSAPVFTGNFKDQVVLDFIHVMAGSERRRAAISVLHCMTYTKISTAEAHQTLKTLIMLANASTRRAMGKEPFPPVPPRGKRPPRLQLIDGDRPDKKQHTPRLKKPGDEK